MGRRGAGCFHRALESILGFRDPPELLERLAQPIQTFGIELAAIGVFLKLGQRLFGLSQLQVGRAQASPCFARRMLVVQSHSGGEVPARVFVALLLQGDDAQLMMRIGLAGIDLDGFREPGNRFAVIAALLIDQAELIVRVGIARIHR